MTTDEKTICARCGKAIDKSGSMTQWIFPTSKCACYEDDQLQHELCFCPVCGLRMQGREGTMTGWIFRSKACECLETTASHKRLAPETIGLPTDDLVEDERFEWISVAGQGGMGTVYKARHRKLARMIAVKVMQADTTNPGTRELFLREARAASKLQHPNIVSVADFGIMNDGRQFLAIEWIDGITLAEYLERHGPLSVESSKEIFIQVLDGLVHAHNRGVVHRDIKPKNIMIGKTPSGGWTVKIIDFGTAKDLNSDGFTTRAEDMACSPFYVSPERINGLLVDHRADLYSLGCTYFESLIGRPPFTGAALQVVMMHLAELPPSLNEASDDRQFPEDLEKFVARLLGKRPDDRIQTAEEAKEALQQIHLEEPRLKGLQHSQPYQKDIGFNRKSFLFSSLIGAAMLGALAVTMPRVLNPEESALSGPMLHPKFERKARKKAQESRTEDSNFNPFSASEELFSGATEAIADVSDKQKISKIKRLAHLRKLSLYDGESLPNTLFSGFASQNVVREVTLESCRVDGPPLLPLADFRHLDWIHLRKCILTEDGARTIAKMKSVTQLDLKGCDFKDNALCEIGKTQNLKSLSVGSSNVTDDHVNQLRHLNVVKLDLSQNPISGICFKNLSCKRTLVTLVLKDCSFLEAKYLAFLKEYPKLYTIELDGFHIGRDALLALKDVPKLRSLYFPRCTLDSDAYPVLSEFRNIYLINLSDTRTTDSDIEVLKKFKRLRHLDISNCDVTPQGLQVLREHCPRIEIVQESPRALLPDSEVDRQQ